MLVCVWDVCMFEFLYVGSFQMKLNGSLSLTICFCLSARAFARSVRVFWRLINAVLLWQSWNDRLIDSSLCEVCVIAAGINSLTKQRSKQLRPTARKNYERILIRAEITGVGGIRWRHVTNLMLANAHACTSRTPSAAGVNGRSTWDWLSASSQYINTDSDSRPVNNIPAVQAIVFPGFKFTF